MCHSDKFMAIRETMLAKAYEQGECQEISIDSLKRQQSSTDHGLWWLRSRRVLLVNVDLSCYRDTCRENVHGP